MQSTKPAVAAPENEEASCEIMVSRRDLLKTAAGAGAVMMIPALQGCVHADDSAWQAAGKAADFPKGTPQRIALKGGSVLYITRTDDATLTAVSAKCTHRGCELGWDKDQKELICPCHGAAFGSDGKNVHGTMRRPDQKLGGLQTVPVRQNNGQVEINLTGIAADTLTPARDA
jgi:nitrite reductase/ring-hydroxylating ferredoxin subunit